MTRSTQSDPWVEQARRQAAHLAVRRRKRRRWLIPLLALAVVAALATAAAVVPVVARHRAREAAEPSAVTIPLEATIASAPPVAAAELVAVDEVWLIDRGDGTFDWGVAVRTRLGAPSRSGVEVAVRLIAANDDVIESVRDILGVIDSDSPAAVAGRFIGAGDDPVRIEFDISVGEVTAELALADLLDVRALERDGDEMTGRIRSSAPGEIDDLRLLFVWHDDNGDVIATAPLEIDRLRSGVDARFSIDLSIEVVPDGPPDAEFWVQ
ncbi:MAG: hypothetical protein P8O03_06025 [Ilumatobacter sp.]|nr:hypothetical protein [Ilumatobacter sp.]MDG2039407.1 hypothetical protein [Ilumatobacter sp.]